MALSFSQVVNLFKLTPSYRSADTVLITVKRSFSIRGSQRIPSYQSIFPRRSLMQFGSSQRINLRRILKAMSSEGVSLNFTPKVRHGSSGFLYSAQNPKETHSTVLVEGNIGCGKAELLNYLRNESAVEVFEEPIELWRNKDGKNLLDLMYKDPKKHSFEFQRYVLETMMDLHEMGLEKPVSLLERSVYSARYVFVENLWRNQLMNEEEYRLLENQFQQYLNGSRNIGVDLIIYIRASPATVRKRILQRGRKEEESISEDYLGQLHARYEDWLVHGKFPLPAPVLTIDGEVPLRDVFSQIESRKREILFGWNNQFAEKPFRFSFERAAI